MPQKHSQRCAERSVDSTVLCGAILSLLAVLLLSLGCDLQSRSSSSPSQQQQQQQGPPPPPVLVPSGNQQTSESLPHGTSDASDSAKPSNGERPTATGAPAHKKVAQRRYPGRVFDKSTSPTTTRNQAFFKNSAKLSAGVALPQLLANGTTMGFSVDYVLRKSLPLSSGQTVWVIESAKGGTGEIAVQLDEQGNLSTFVEGMKPEHGPFHSYLAIRLQDGSLQPISPRLAMQSP